MKFMQILGIKIIFQSSQYQSQNRFYWNWDHHFTCFLFGWKRSLLVFTFALFWLVLSLLTVCFAFPRIVGMRSDGVKLWFRFGRQLSNPQYFVGSQFVSSEKSLPILAYVVQMLVYCLIRVALCFYSSSMQMQW